MCPLPDKIVMSSGNVGKLREIARIFNALNIIVVPQSDFGISAVEENGATFAENAEIKARHAAGVTGLPAIADDSGLAVDALGGRPGVYSARYSGPDADDQSNIDKLLHELDDVPDDERGAAFHCTACFVMPNDADALLAAGEWRGIILRERRGDRGFGYDPVFFDVDIGLSAAQLTTADKNARSHRGKALQELVRQLRSG